MRPRGLVFDLDGTLLDSCDVHFEIYRTVLGSIGIEFTRELFERTYSANWYETYRALDIPRERWRDLDRYWIEQAGHRPARAFPGVESTLKLLSEGYRLGIYTSGSRPRVEAELDLNRLTGYFRTVVTGDDISEPKPSPQGLLLALEGMGVGADEALYIGDAEADRKAARGAQVGFVGVVSDFNGFDEGTTPDLRRVTELPAYLETLR